MARPASDSPLLFELPSGPDFSTEISARGKGIWPVAGTDEAGRGPLAGPVVAAAVVLDLRRLPDSLRFGLNDSKKLSPERRAALAEALPDYASVAVAGASVAEIDGLNVLQASLLAMRRAAAALGLALDAALVDGKQTPGLDCPCRCLVGGDGLSLSVAAASILAKVERDRRMEELNGDFPGYGWERNRGYGTAEHLAALRRIGPSPEHRRSFAPIRELLSTRS